MMRRRFSSQFALTTFVRLGRKWSVIFGLLSALATGGVYLVGAGRAYDYDSSETVGAFVATKSLLDPFRRQLQFNNHPLFSFLDHVVYSLGGHSELALRVLPIVCAALCVGVLAGWAASRWGAAAGLSAAVVLATNPSFAVLARSVRGYSLLTLAAIVSSLLLVELLEGDEGRLWPVYSAVLAVAVATHLYAVFVLLAQAAFAASRGRLDWKFARWWSLGFLSGLSGYSLLAQRMVTSALHEHGLFQPHLPEQLASALLGTHPTAILTLALLVIVGATTVPRRQLLVTVTTLTILLAMVWLVATPRDLYPRFFIWLAPAVALFAAAANRRTRLALPLAIVAGSAMCLIDVPRWNINPVPSQQAADLVTDTRDLGDRPCILPDVRGALMAYITTPPEITTPKELSRCDLSIAAPFDPHRLLTSARTDYPYRWRLPAETPYLVYARFSPRTVLG
jgi:hypothetical protein